MNGTDRRARALASFARVTGLPELASLVQRGRDPETARYTLNLTDGRAVRIGTIKVLWSQSELGQVLAVAVGHVPPTLDRNDWRNAVAALINHAVDVHETPGESFEDTVADWVRRYGARAQSDKDGAAPAGIPFTDDGDLHVSANDLARYVRREFSEQVKLHDLRQALVDIGFERVTVHYSRAGGKRSSTSYYRAALERLEAA